VVYLGFPEHLPAYTNKGIDASITNEPTMTRAIEAGVAVRIVGNDVTYPDQQTAVVFYADDFIRNRRDVAERFMRAYMRGIRFYNDALKGGHLAAPRRRRSYGSWSRTRRSRTPPFIDASCRAPSTPTAA